MSSDFSILSDNDDLPMGWELTKMEDLVIDPKSDIVDGPFGSNLKASEYQDTGIPIIRLQNIDRNRFINSNIKFVSPEKAESLARHSFVKGNIAITKLGEPLGKACIIPDFLEKGIIVADIVRVRVDEDKVNSTYLTYSINSQDVIEQLQNQTKGTTRARVNLSHIREIQIPLPPLNEQRRIVEKVEALMARSRKAKEALDAIPKLIEQFRQSVLAAAFRGDLTADWREQNPNIEPASVLLKHIRKEREIFNQSTKDKLLLSSEIDEEGLQISDIPESWEIVQSKELFSFVTSGSRGWAKYYSEKGSIFIRMGNLNRQTIKLDLDSIQRVQLPQGIEGTRTKVKENDILISITADCGMIGIVPASFPEAYVNQHVALARPINYICPQYLAWYLASSEGGVKQFRELQRGATKVGLVLGDIQSILIPLPSLQEQIKIVEVIDMIFKRIEYIESEYMNLAKNLDTLNQSILSKAFRGELVEQDPNDEPASVLLERIQKEREKEKKTVKQTGTKKTKKIEIEN
ncbi:restriction endonuclease subunit S [Pseudanabaena galeata UHCC 0370]|uniref:Restriction endonuclease subunit S n=1 Tax=Pseudanabaena galeata UHCC 0370 TaxID=3110310 RepID=A0ABU5TMQ3_9CYAN|nr:restriction endonuclease subunit S [Pseudanabaena galeata]MEA5479581.1 restriction endonuclease subunit S [Pseudanabaena galeata UHCC 0370]